jgi:hypothetical protein
MMEAARGSSFRPESSQGVRVSVCGENLDGYHPVYRRIQSLVDLPESTPAKLGYDLVSAGGLYHERLRI